jgi:hypothetical protein
MAIDALGQILYARQRSLPKRQKASAQSCGGQNQLAAAPREFAHIY